MVFWVPILAASAAVAALLLVPLVRALAIKLGIVDEPGELRRIHSRRTARAGGLAVFAVLASVLGAAGSVQSIAPYVDGLLVRTLLFGGAPLLIVGLIDDKKSIRPFVKVLAQICGAAIALWVGFSPAITSSFGPAVNGVLFVGWVVLSTNAYNLIDGMDGLAASVGLVALTATCTYAVLLGNTSVILPTAVLGGALLGFLRYNTAPASIFLGDSGSLFVGYSLSVLTMAGAHRDGRGIALLLPLAALAVPTIDTTAAIARRWLRRVPLSRPDARHVHHRLAALGYGPRGVVTVVYVLSSALAGGGIIIGLAPREASVALAVLGMALLAWLLLYGANRLDYHEFIEAIDLLLAAPRRARQVIRTQIVLRDLVPEIRETRTLAELNALFEERAPQLGVTSIALERLTHPQEILKTLSGEFRTIWCPLRVTTWGTTLPNVLAVTSPRDPQSNTGVVERVVRLLEPELEAWLAIRPTDPISERLRVALDTTGAAHAGRREDRELAHLRMASDPGDSVGVARALRTNGRDVALNAPHAGTAEIS